MNAAAFRKLALSLPEASERPHFDRSAFRTTRRTFATLSSDGLEVNLMLQPEQQAVLVRSSSAFQKLDNAWGDKGATRCVLARVTLAQLRPALLEAHALAMPRVKT
jgi:hypothetical protein